MIAVCDHNTAGNVPAVQQAGEAAGGGLAVIAGMELTSAEEVHVVGLFPDAAAAERRGRPGALPPPPGRCRLLLVLRRAAPARRRRAPGRLRDRRPGAGHPARLERGGRAHPQRGRAGRGGPYRPQVVQRLLPAGLLPRGRGLRRAGGIQVATRPIRRGWPSSRLWGCPCSAPRTATTSRRSGRPAPSSVWRSRRSPNWLSLWRGPGAGASRGGRRRRRRRTGRRPCMTSPSICSRCSRTRRAPGASHVDVELVDRPRLRRAAAGGGRRRPRPDRHAGADPRPLLHHQAGQEDRPGPEPAQGRRPSGRGRPPHRAVAQLWAGSGWRPSCG